ncbi:hypothetical protein AN1V17_27590 [Vallitalea sediminicola]
MNDTQKFQKDVVDKMKSYFIKKLTEIDFNNSEDRLKKEYEKQLKLICTNYKTKAKRFADYDICEVIISALSEPCTYYTNDNFIQSGNLDSIYSPRIDLSFSPIIKKNNSKSESIGVYSLTDDVKLFDFVHNLDFIRNLEKLIRDVSNKNMNEFRLPRCDIGISNWNYPNKRPLHLFGIEIENQKNTKHLMGDFFNAINLSKIPVIVVPESNINNLMNMLKYNKTIQDLKQLPTFKMLSKVSVITVRQFREILNRLLECEGLGLINVETYN